MSGWAVENCSWNMAAVSSNMAWRSATAGQKHLTENCNVERGCQGNGQARLIGDERAARPALRVLTEKVVELTDRIRGRRLTIASCD
jgi:hypothetical protein